MHAGKQFSLWEFLVWTRRDSYWLLLIATVPTVLYAWADIRWIAVPWVPVALVGTAAAFIVGFRNNATYGRLWEARTIWGAIVNSSRGWAILARDLVQPVADFTASQAIEAREQLIHRHIAWLTALRYQLRTPRAWETISEPNNVEYRRRYEVPERSGNLDGELSAVLSPDELHSLATVSNRATQVLALQSAHVASLASRGVLDPYRQVELQRMLVDLYAQQGKCERIKNFPYPRQFATINLFFVRLFMWLLPFGMLNEFQTLGDGYVWLTIPFSFLVGWVFNAMEKVGVATENPFEGGANDVPISALSRTIEIDLRELLGETEIPPPLAPVNFILM